MKPWNTITIGIALALAGHATGVAAQEDLAACGRKAVEAGIEPGKVDAYVAACVSERKAGRESVAREKGKSQQQAGSDSADPMAKENKAGNDKAEEGMKSKADKGTEAAKDRGEDKMKGRSPKKEKKEKKEKKP